MQKKSKLSIYLIAIIYIYRMEGGELFNRIQEKKSFTEKGKKLY